MVGFFVFGAGLLGLATLGDIPAIFTAVFIGFIGLPWINVALVTLRQQRSPDEMLGRITAASRAIAWGSLPVGAAIAGYMSDNVLGLDTMLFVSPFLLFIIGTLLLLTPVWRTTRVDSPVR